MLGRKGLELTLLVKLPLIFHSCNVGSTQNLSTIIARLSINFGLSTVFVSEIVFSTSKCVSFEIPQILVSFIKCIRKHGLIICVDSHGGNCSVIVIRAVGENVSEHLDVLRDLESWHQRVCFPVKVIQS